MDLLFPNIGTEESVISSVLEKFYTDELEKLIDIESFSKITGFTNRFTKNLSPFFGYELHLGTQNSDADFLCCISNPKYFGEYVKAEIQSKSGSKFDKAILNGLENFSRFWLESNKSSIQQINNIWFEFDYAEIEKKRPKACFFFGPKLSLNKLEVVLLTENVFQQIFQKKVEPVTLKTLLRIYGVLGKEQIISQIGMMNSRGDNSLRLFIQGNGKSWILPFLSALDYPFIKRHDFISQLDECLNLASVVDLDIDIYERIGNKTGFECYFKTTEEALGFLENITNKGLVIPQKAKKLRDYLLTIKTNKSNLFQPFLSHFKLVYHPSNGFYAKAYIGYVNHKQLSNIIQTKPAKINCYEKN